MTLTYATQHRDRRESRGVTPGSRHPGEGTHRLGNSTRTPPGPTHQGPYLASPSTTHSQVLSWAGTTRATQGRLLTYHR